MSDVWPGLSLDSKYIHRGGWTNWNENLFDGGRITTSKQAADLLMVFIGIFLVLMEAGLCSLITFGIFLWHRRDKVSRRSRDALWHQGQTVLRNSGDFMSIAGKYIALWQAYGWRKPHVALRVAPVVVLGVLTSGIFLVALPFLTTFVMLNEDGNEVLINSKQCGLWEVETDKVIARRTTESSIRWNTAMQYVDSCYEASGDSGLCDNFLYKRKLEWDKSSVTCPFDDSACLGDDLPARKITTKVLDTHWDLGLNAPPKDRVQFRRSATCSPIDLSGDLAEILEGDDGSETMYLYLGAEGDDDDVQTFWSNLEKQTAMPAYMLHGYEAFAGIWTPIKELQRTKDALISLVLLNNPGFGFDEPSDDPFFFANKTRTTDSFYYPPVPLTAIGCVEQFEFRNPARGDDGDWTDPMSITGYIYSFGERKGRTEDQTKTISETLGLNSKQEATLQLLLWSLTASGSIGDMIATIGSSALRARKDPGTYGRTQNPLPSNHWESEVAYWVNIGLATLQLQFVQFAAGPLKQENVINRPAMADMLCDAQMIKHPEFENFRRSGFISLAVLGGFFIFFPWIFLKATLLLGRRQGWESVLEWISYGEMQLLRMANEGAGVEGWEGCDEEVPFNKATEIARVVDLGPVVVGDAPIVIEEAKPAAHPRMRYLPAEKTVSIRASVTEIPLVEDAEQMGVSDRRSAYTPLERDSLLSDISSMTRL